MPARNVLSYAAWKRGMVMAMPLRSGPQSVQLCTLGRFKAARRSIYTPSKTTGVSHRSMSTEAAVTHSPPLPSVGWVGNGTVALTWPDGKHTDLHPMFLRDNCTCSACRDSQQKQRLIDPLQIPGDIQAQIVRAEDKGLNVRWANDGHESIFDWQWLRNRVENPFARKTKAQLWGSEIAANPPTVMYDAVMSSSEGMKDWVNNIRDWGFCLVQGVPPTLKDTEKCLEKIAYAKSTHYGGFWSVEANNSFLEKAFTTGHLDAHTDNTYLTDPAGLLGFHMISPDVQGGESLLIDGFKAAEILRHESPEGFEILTKIKLPWHTTEDGNFNIMPAEKNFPVIELEDSAHGQPQQISRIRWNNDDRAALGPPLNPTEVDAWYSAARKWLEIIRRPEVEYWQRLNPGTMMVFDNWRCLHGRAAFTGSRTLCGAYMNMDDFVSRWKVLNFSDRYIDNSL